MAAAYHRLFHLLEIQPRLMMMRISPILMKKQNSNLSLKIMMFGTVCIYGILQKFGPLKLVKTMTILCLVMCKHGLMQELGAHHLAAAAAHKMTLTSFHQHRNLPIFPT